ncbi:MAG: hypothetical protein ABJL44_10845 [Algibacter sp.]
MIKSSFSEIFSLEVLHSYYQGDICKGLSYNPILTSEDLMKRFSFKQRLTDTGFSFYTNSDSIAQLLNYITHTTGETSFEFEVTTEDPHFYQFTDLPINQIGIIKYNSGSISSVSETNEIVLKSEFVPVLETNILFNITINFEDLIALNNKQDMTYYQIQFEARSTQWKYYILNNSAQFFGQLSINGTSEINFEGPEDVMLQNGENALLFSSGDALLALSEIPKYSFNLISTTKKSDANRSKIIFKGLPNPNPNTLEIVTDKATPLVASLMYVYI